MVSGAASKWLPLFLVTALMIAAWATGLQSAFTLASFKEHKKTLVLFVEQRPLLSAMVFVITYSASVALSLPIASFLTFVGGFLFGRWLGTLYVVTAATAGATIVFLIARSSFGAALRQKAGPLYTAVEREMHENAFQYLLFLRLCPVFPFVLVNILPALFNMPLSAYVAATLIGILPGSFVYVNVGRTLGEARNAHDLVSPEVILAFTLLGLLSLVPIVIKKMRARGALALLAASLLSSLSLQADAAVGGPHSTDYGQFLSAYSQLLGRHLHAAQSNGIAYRGVDYRAWSHDPDHAPALEHLLSSDPESFLTSDERKAFWINAYNFLTIDLIVRTGETASIKDLGSLFVSPWKKYMWQVGGKGYTLDDLENKILRPMKDPRIHFAINCASVSCPDLRGEPYVADDLDGQLDSQVRETLKNPSKGMMIADDRTVYLTKIARWYREDFDNGNLERWLRRYRNDLPEGQFDIRFFDYDWSLNKSDTETRVR